MAGLPGASQVRGRAFAQTARIRKSPPDPVAGARKTGSAGRAPRTPKAPDPNLIAAAEKLQSAIGTKVKIVSSGTKGGGRIELHAYSSEEMDRLYNLILGAVDRAV